MSGADERAERADVICVDKIDESRARIVAVAETRRAFALIVAPNAHRIVFYASLAALERVKAPPHCWIVGELIVDRFARPRLRGAELLALKNRGDVFGERDAHSRDEQTLARRARELRIKFRHVAKFGVFGFYWAACLKYTSIIDQNKDNNKKR